MAVESPCVRNCCLDENDICLGCFRTVEEITAWGKDEEADYQVLVNALERKNCRNINSKYKL